MKLQSENKMGDYCNLIQVVLFFLLYTHSFVHADIFLTAENLNTSLKQLQRYQLQLQETMDYAGADPLYQLGIVAEDLAKLLTDEVIAHGPENEKLIELALQRTGEIAIKIDWVSENEAFYYDGEAFRLYLQEFPDGEYAADSQFRIIKRDFYLAVTEGEDTLQEAIKTKQTFINRYPEFQFISEVELFLAIDYRDLWRHYREISDTESASLTAENVQEQYQHISVAYQDKEAGDIARRLLARFQAELEQSKAVPQ